MTDLRLGSAVHLAIDMQLLFAEPRPWCVPWLPRTLPLVVEPLRALVPPARLCDKAVYSAFGHPKLAAWLETQGADTLILSGGETDVCVLATVMSGPDPGFHVVLATDALCSVSDATHDAPRLLYRERFSQQITTATIEKILQAWNQPHPYAANGVGVPKYNPGGTDGQVFAQRQQGSEERLASQEEWFVEERHRRHGEEQEAGDRHRPLGSAQEGQEGADAEDGKEEGRKEEGGEEEDRQEEGRQEEVPQLTRTRRTRNHFTQVDVTAQRNPQVRGMVGTVIGENEQEPASALPSTGVRSVAAETARWSAKQLSFRSVAATLEKSTAACGMVNAVIGEKEQRPDPTLSWGGILSVAAATARDAAMQPSFWFAAAIVAGALSVGLAAWEGGAIHDGRLN